VRKQAQQETVIERALRRIGYVNVRPASVIQRVELVPPWTAARCVRRDRAAGRYAGVYQGTRGCTSRSTGSRSGALVPFHSGAARRRSAVEQDDQPL